MNLVTGALVLLVLAAVSIDRLLSGQLMQEFDDGLLAKARIIAGLVEREGNAIEFDRVSRFMPEFESRKPLEYYELSLDNGSMFHESPSLQGATLAGGRNATDEPQFRNLVLPSGKAGRLVSFTFKPRLSPEGESDAEEDEEPEESGEAAGVGIEENEDEVEYHLSRDEAKRDPGVSIVLAKGTATVDRLILVSRMIVGTAFVLLVVGLALLTWVSVRRNLAPLRNLSRDVEALDEHKLHKRVQRAQDVEELEPITRQLNNLLDRLERAFHREKRFSGDVAHELRTPISELRALSEVGREWADERDMVEGFFGDLVNLADDMERTVTNLLMLARLDAGSQIIELEIVGLRNLVDKIWKRFKDDADGRYVKLENNIVDDLYVRTDKDKLAMMLINIISNAVAYSAEGTVISVESSKLNETVYITITNTAPDLAGGDLDVMLERFWRKDQSRTSRGHAGLGLSLVKELGQLLGMAVELGLDSHSRFSVTLSGLKKAREY